MALYVVNMLPSMYLPSLFLQLTIPFQSVQAITKEKTALVIPNAIQISTTNDKYGFSSLGNRDMTYNIVFKCWQNVLLEQVHLLPIQLSDKLKAGVCIHVCILHVY